MTSRFKLTTIVFVVLFLFYYLVTNFYPDFLWFSSFGFEDLWFFTLKSKVIVFLAGFLLAYSWFSLNLRIANKNSEEISEVSHLEFNTPFAFVNNFLTQLRNNTRQNNQLDPASKAYKFLLRVGAFVLSIFFALAARSWWQDIYYFLNQVSFGVSDPIFDKDISFYLFSVPFFQHVQNWFFALFLFSLGFTAWIYFTRNILLIVFSKVKHAVVIKRHILILVALLAFTYAVGTWLDIYELTTAYRSEVFIGTGFTDHNILIPALKLLTGLIVLQAILFFVWAFTSWYKAPLVVTVLIVLVQVFGVNVVPNLVQNYIVTPNEMEKEKEYIKHNIHYTRLGYNLGNINSREFPANNNLTLDKVQQNDSTIRNIRLWNQGPLKQTFSQLQEIRLYYEFEEVDVDRYMINGKLQQVMLSPRELDTNQLPKKTWINTRLSFTHGYGVCMSPVNQITPEGLPKFYMMDLPPKSTIDLEIKRPEIYFGEKTNNYILVNTKHDEFDYPKGDKNVYTQYQGKGGIVLDSFLKRLIYALKFSDFKILVSSLITSDSKLVYDRNIKQIVRKIAPFLLFDNDPYLVITDEGRMVWMQDAYTYSSQFPYSELDPYLQKINYIRNTVKITMDAYDGSVKFYVIDPSDPIIATYSKVYPDLFYSFDEMPANLQEHIRYPKDLFTLQARMFTAYHMSDHQVFYNREDLWEIPKEKKENEELEEMKAYYMVLKLPEEESESFNLMLPFTPRNKNNMIGWLTAKCDLDNYGQLQVYKLPKERTIYGPLQIESRIDQDTQISQKLTLWGQVGSRVIRGNLMVVPIEESLVYVEPIYLQATQSKLPELKRVIFSYKDNIVMSETLHQAISVTFEGDYFSEKEEPQMTLNEAKSNESTLDQLIKTFKEFKNSAKQLNWTDFGKKLNELDQIIDNLKQ